MRPTAAPTPPSSTSAPRRRCSPSPTPSRAAPPAPASASTTSSRSSTRRRCCATCARPSRCARAAGRRRRRTTAPSRRSSSSRLRAPTLSSSSAAAVRASTSRGSSRGSTRRRRSSARRRRRRGCSAPRASPSRAARAGRSARSPPTAPPPATATATAAVRDGEFASVAFRCARAPLHPARLHAALRRAADGGLVRLRGVVWLATRPVVEGVASLAGAGFTLSAGAPWWAAVDEAAWPAGLRDELAPRWREPHGAPPHGARVRRPSRGCRSRAAALDGVRARRRRPRRRAEAWAAKIRSREDFDRYDAPRAFRDARPAAPAPVPPHK